MRSKEQYIHDKLPCGIEITQFVYLIFAVIITFALLIFLTIPRGINQKFWEGCLAAIIFWTLFYGTYKVKNWVVAPVLIVSAFYVFWGVIEIVNFKPINFFELVKKELLLLRTVFFLFQLYIFSKPETKTFFQDKGKTIF